MHFSDGKYVKVYKGVHKDEVIAVKKLYSMQGINDKEFTMRSATL